MKSSSDHQTHILIDEKVGKIPSINDDKLRHWRGVSQIPNFGDAENLPKHAASPFKPQPKAA